MNLCHWQPMNGGVLHQPAVGVNKARLETGQGLAMDIIWQHPAQRAP